MTTSRLNNPGRRAGRRASNPELGSKVPRRSGGGRRTTGPVKQRRMSGALSQEAQLALGLDGLASGLVLRNCLFRVGWLERSVCRISIIV